MIIALASLIKNTKKKTIVHASNPQQYSTMGATTTRFNFKPTWDVKTCNQESKCDVTPPKLSSRKIQVYLTDLDFIINFRRMF